MMFFRAAMFLSVLSVVLQCSESIRFIVTGALNGLFILHRNFMITQPHHVFEFNATQRRINLHFSPEVSVENVYSLQIISLRSLKYKACCSQCLVKEIVECRNILLNFFP
jgi:hypothetical protein